MGTQSADRRARVAQLQREQQRAEFRRGLAIVGGAVVGGALIIGAAIVGVIRAQNQQDEIQVAARGDIEGVQAFSELSRNHVDTTVDYGQNPPAGGDHASVWANCGAYSDAVVPEQGVHSLEHGAVWITYQRDLDDTQVEDLSDLAGSNDYLLVSPRKTLPSPIVLSAWGVQLGVDSPDDPRVATFIEKYQQGPQTPEPGAVCSGGAGTPE